MMQLFRNKYRVQSHRMSGYNYSLSGFYFVTICTQYRVCCFGDVVDGNMVLNTMGNIVQNEILNTSNIRKNVVIDSFVVMPNHVHMILFCTDQFVETDCICLNHKTETVSFLGDACNASLRLEQNNKHLEQNNKHLEQNNNRLKQNNNRLKQNNNRFGPQIHNLGSMILCVAI